MFSVVGLFGLLQLPHAHVVNGGAVAALAGAWIIGRIDGAAGVAFAVVALALDALGQLAIAELGSAAAALLFVIGSLVG